MEKELGADYYLPQQIEMLIEQANVDRKQKGLPPLTISTFYRRVEKGIIGSYPPNRQKRQKAAGYRKADVDAFLKGELSARRSMREQDKQKTNQQSRSRVSPAIDIVYPDDLPAMGFMETQQLGWEVAIPANVILSWLKKNGHLYWMQYNPKNRRGLDGVLAVLGVLPLNEELIHKVLKGEIQAKQIMPDDILVYEPGKTYTCLIASTTALPGYESATRLLLQHVLAYWCENSINVSHLYALGSENLEATPLMRLIAESFFSPIETTDRSSTTLWDLRFKRYNPSSFVQEYQKCISRKNVQENEDMSESTMVLDMEEEILPIEQELGDVIHKRVRNFDRLDRRLYKVDANGRLDADRLEQDVRFRRVSSDEDIRACLRINASLFGDSKKYTENELVAQRKTWLAVNPDIYHVLEVDREVVGFISAFPLPMPTITPILHSEIRMGDVSIDELQVYKPGVPVSIYLQTIGVHKKYQGLAKRRLGIFMSSGFRDMINRLGVRGMEIDAIYTRSDEPDGINMAYNLGFTKLSAIPGVNKVILKLDFARRDLPFLAEYQRRLENYRAKQSAHIIRTASR